MSYEINNNYTLCNGLTIQEQQRLSLDKLEFVFRMVHNPFERHRVADCMDFFEQNHRFLVAKQLAKCDDFAFNANIHKFQLTVDQRFEIAKMLVNKGDNVVDIIRIFRLKSYPKVDELVLASFLRMGRVPHELKQTNKILAELTIPALDQKMLKPINTIDLSMNNPILVDRIKHFVLVFSCCFALLPPDQQKVILDLFAQSPELLKTIFRGRDSTVYWLILESLLYLKPEHLAVLKSKTDERQMTLIPLLALGLDEETTAKVLKADVRDMQVRNPLIKVFFTLQNDRKLNKEIHTKIIDWIVKEPKKREQVKSRCAIISSIFGLGFEKKLLNTTSYEEVLSKGFCEKVSGLDNQQNISQQLQSTFFSMRQPNAILVYSACLQKDSLYEHSLKSDLCLFINSVLDGTFHQVRRDPEHNPHLKRLHELHPETLEKFHRASEVSTTVTDVCNESRPNVIRQMLLCALSDRHMEDSDLDYVNDIPVEERDFTRLRDVLNNTVDVDKALSQNFSSDNVNLKKYLRLQWYLIKLLKPDATKSDWSNCECVVLRQFGEYIEIVQDIRGMRTLFEVEDVLKTNKIDPKQMYKLSNTDNPYEILLCGTEVAGSCQRIDGNSLYNQGLLGYLLNGQTRLITLKTEGDDKIKGRAIFRLLFDENDAPVLLMEKVYPEALPSHLKLAIVQFAENLAQQLGVQLVGGKKRYQKKIICYGARAAEYVDSDRGLRTTFQL